MPTSPGIIEMREGKVTSLPDARPHERSESRFHWTAETSIGVFLAMDGSAVVAVWVLSLSSDAFGGIAGLLVYQDGNLPILHLTAEVSMRMLSLLSGIDLIRRRPWAIVATGVLVLFSAPTLLHGLSRSKLN